MDSSDRKWVGLVAVAVALSVSAGASTAVSLSSALAGAGLPNPYQFGVRDVVFPAASLKSVFR